MRFVEAYRNLRSSLLYMAEAGQRPRTILVTSSVPNDGKSLTAANLAITMASAGSRVLLVDADLRKGALHRRFGVPAEPGLSEVLSKGVRLGSGRAGHQVQQPVYSPRGRIHGSIQRVVHQRGDQDDSCRMPPPSTIT